MEATPGEILGEDEEHAFVRDYATGDTRVRTGIAWLEEADLLSREENWRQRVPLDAAGGDGGGGQEKT